MHREIKKIKKSIDGKRGRLPWNDMNLAEVGAISRARSQGQGNQEARSGHRRRFPVFEFRDQGTKARERRRCIARRKLMMMGLVSPDSLSSMKTMSPRPTKRSLAGNAAATRSTKDSVPKIATLRSGGLISTTHREFLCMGTRLATMCPAHHVDVVDLIEIGRASCRERVCNGV